MLFSSIPFIFQFLPITLVLYYIAPKKLQNVVLMLMSLVFYAWGEIKYLPLMVILILLSYFYSLLMRGLNEKEKARKFLLIIMIIVSLGLLVTFKYLDFLILNVNNLFLLNIKGLKLALPLGISFFTFQNISYAVDVYRRKVEPQKNFIILGTYIVMFPQLISGPIVRYSDIEPLLRHRTLKKENIENGMEDFIIGLAMKMLLANNVGKLWTEIENLGFSRISKSLAWLAIIAYSLQIYFDFAGYSRMAIGLGKMLGFSFNENFDTPYISRSATEFWRRWHISLGSWFRDYVYFPLGGSRKGNGRTILNLLVVWVLTGLWHGASWNFLIWGVYFFILLVIEKNGFISFLNKRRWISHIYMIFVIPIGWALFAISDFSLLVEFFKKLFIPKALLNIDFVLISSRYYLRNYALILVLAILLSTSLGSKLLEKIKKNNVIKVILLSVLFLLSVIYMIDSSFSPFLYFRF